jgi:hypothetical protein
MNLIEYNSLFVNELNACHNEGGDLLEFFSDWLDKHGQDGDDFKQSINKESLMLFESYLVESGLLKQTKFEQPDFY